ncbi:MAG: hypothetical protein ACP5N3_04315 [Candidatus Nanoarchaeia archaeon]
MSSKKTMDNKESERELTKLRDESAREAWLDFKNQYLPKAGFAFLIIMGMVAVEKWNGKEVQTNKEHYKPSTYFAPQPVQDYEHRNNQIRIQKMYIIAGAQIEIKSEKNIIKDKNYSTIDAKF